MQARQQGLLFAHLAAVLFGMTGVLGALIHADPAYITFGRALLAALCLALVAWRFPTPSDIPLNPILCRRLAISGSMLCVHWYTFFYAIHLGGVAMATLGFASFPAFITLIERWILRERVSTTAWVLVAVVMTGLVLVAPSFEPGQLKTVSLFWGVISGLSFAILAVFNRSLSHTISPIRVALWQNAVVALLCLPMLWWAPVVPTGNDWLWLALLGIFCTALSHYLFVSSVKHINARTTGLIIALEPVYAMAVAWWLFNESPTYRILLGAVLIIGAALYPQRSAST